MSDAERIIDLYDRKAHAWIRDRERQSRFFEKPWLDRFLALIPSAADVLDIGCGSGHPIARHIIESGLNLTGADSSRAMIDTCRHRFPAQTWIVADMRTLDVQKRFAGILAWDSFFHLKVDDQRQMFAVFRQHALPKAALMFTSGPAHGEAIGTFEGEPLYHASLDADEYRSLLADNGFYVVSHDVEAPDCGGHTIWLAQSI